MINSISLETWKSPGCWPGKELEQELAILFSSENIECDLQILLLLHHFRNFVHFSSLAGVHVPTGLLSFLYFVKLVGCLRYGEQIVWELTRYPSFSF